LGNSTLPKPTHKLYQGTYKWDSGLLQNLKKKCLIYRMINSTLLIERMAGQCGKSFTIVPIVMNCFIRIKWVLTEATHNYKIVWWECLGNTTRQFNNVNWTNIKSTRRPALQNGLLNAKPFSRWFRKKFIHPDNNKEFTIKEIIATYAWHGKHHLAHITELKNSRMVIK
jgi:hypothetical protein